MQGAAGGSQGLAGAGARTTSGRVSTRPRAVPGCARWAHRGAEGCLLTASSCTCTRARVNTHAPAPQVLAGAQAGRSLPPAAAPPLSKALTRAAVLAPARAPSCRRPRSRAVACMGGRLALDLCVGTRTCAWCRGKGRRVALQPGGGSGLGLIQMLGTPAWSWDQRRPSPTR